MKPVFTFVAGAVLAAGLVITDAQRDLLVHWIEVLHGDQPEAEGAEYIAVCLPAFSPATVHRDDG